MITNLNIFLIIITLFRYQSFIRWCNQYQAQIFRNHNVVVDTRFIAPVERARHKFSKISKPWYFHLESISRVSGRVVRQFFYMIILTVVIPLLTIINFTINIFRDGVRPGDIITHINEQPALSSDDIYRALKMDSSFFIRVIREGQELNIKVTPRDIWSAKYYVNVVSQSFYCFYWNKLFNICIVIVILLL